MGDDFELFHFRVPPASCIEGTSEVMQRPYHQKVSSASFKRLELQTSAKLR